MYKNDWKGKLFRTAEFLTMLAVLQLMWIGLILLGGIILGIAPATVGLFSVMRERIQGQDDLKTLAKRYWEIYKREWVSANKIGVILIVIGYFIILNLKILLAMPAGSNFIMLSIMTLITILYAVLCINIFQVFAHYELPFFRYFSTAILLSVSFPIQALGSFLGIFILYKLFAFIPGLLPFFGISLTVIFLTWMSSQIFKMKDELEQVVKLGGEQECQT